MSYTRAIAEHYMQRIRERLLYGMTPSEEAQALAEVATYSRHERDLFALQNTAPSSRESCPGDKSSPAILGCGSISGSLESSHERIV